MKIEEKILEYANRVDKFRTSDLAHVLGGLSRPYISSKLKIMFRRGQLIRAGSGAYVYYSLPEKADQLYEKIRRRIRNKDLQEHEVLESLFRQAPFLPTLKDNVRSIFDYAFSEMLNNAIEHSRSTYIEIEVGEVDGYLVFKVRDFGVGIFRNVMERRKLKNELEAIQDLLKGKVTTEPRSHSGEGVFFTSKVADVFTEESFEYLLRIDNEIDDIFVESDHSTKGTEVTFKISLDSGRHLNDIFEAYQSEPENYAFDKTEVMVKLYQLGTIHVSRSQARRVTANLEKFKKVILDFNRVPTIGQGFADEIFRVYKGTHPKVKIEPINMNDTVRFMVERVEKPR
jgi:hypothetical protein